MGEEEVRTVARCPSPENPSCPKCGAVHVIKAGHTPTGQQRWECKACGSPFGPTLGTPLYRLHTPAAARFGGGAAPG